jgi:hypothetical protein
MSERTSRSRHDHVTITSRPRKRQSLMESLQFHILVIVQMFLEYAAGRHSLIMKNLQVLKCTVLVTRDNEPTFVVFKHKRISRAIACHLSSRTHLRWRQSHKQQPRIFYRQNIRAKLAEKFLENIEHQEGLAPTFSTEDPR